MSNVESASRRTRNARLPLLGHDVVMFVFVDSTTQSVE